MDPISVFCFINLNIVKILLNIAYQALDQLCYWAIDFANTYSQAYKYWDIDTILIFLALYTTTMDLHYITLHYRHLVDALIQSNEH